ncbi:type VII secretion target [Pseudonocardia abyssalis]|uniref:PE domain-containing protein n=1 Tax=Pseudonocardia abyssalis TaxID=2792008 RepID=A0ABS6UZI5_9PSEU|nr:type VII secretion target [Pseudonocardia abyssalis]MBW0114038.1 hypothetical protein [Pseudonocardia abyssalis]MBW0137675.1 hypothetical protein [Pseudonocardia abyssalis]
MVAPDVHIDPEVVQRTAGSLLGLADEVRGTIAAAEVDTVRPDAPPGFVATLAANELWAGWSRQLDQTATDVAQFGHDIAAAATAWQQADAAIAASLGGG